MLEYLWCCCLYGALGSASIRCYQAWLLLLLTKCSGALLQTTWSSMSSASAEELLTCNCLQAVEYEHARLGKGTSAPVCSVAERPEHATLNR